jgi:hypothetical protein
MSISHNTVSITGGANWHHATISNANKLVVEVVDSDSDVQVDVSIDRGSTVADILGPLADRAVRKEYLDLNAYRISFRCAANATVEVTIER